MKNFLTTFMGSVLCATVSLSSLQAMDGADDNQEIWSRISPELHSGILDEAVLNNQKVNVLPCVCKEWEAYFNQPKWIRNFEITSDHYSDTTMPEKLQTNPFVRSLTIAYDVMKFADLGPETDELQMQNLFNFVQIIRQGLCNKPCLRSLTMNAFPLDIFVEKFSIESLYTKESLLKDLDDKKGLTLEANPPAELLQKPWLQCFSNLRCLTLGHVYYSNHNWGYFIHQVLTPEHFPNLEIVSSYGQLDQRFKQK